MVIEFPVSGQNYEGTVVLIREGDSGEPFHILPGESLDISLSVDPSGSSNSKIEVNLKIKFRETFSDDPIVVLSVRGDVKYKERVTNGR